MPHPGEGDTTVTPRSDREPRVRPQLVSVVVPAHNEAENIAQQLRALAEQEYDGAWEVVVADNASTDETVEVVHRFEGVIPRLRVVDASGKRGAGHARNVGTSAARGDLILYCDADDEVAPGWIQAMSDDAPLGDLIVGRREFDKLNPAENRPLITTFAEPAPDSPAFRFLPWASSANLGVWRDAFDAAGGWNTDYRFSQDVEFCWRVQLRGHRYHYCPASLVHHRHRGSRRGFFRQRWNWAVFAPKLYRDFRDAGFSRPTRREVLRGWIWILTRSPYVLMSERRRRLWLTIVAERLGRLWGSYRWRVWCP